jgi:hypothetical protein
MKPSKVAIVASGVVLLGIAMGSAALTLGPTQSIAWLGKPLDVRIQVQSDVVDDLQSGCLAADVLYGDNQVDPARVSVTLSSAMGAGGLQSVRVVSTLTIDEPVVTVQLRVGCQQKLSKRYTLFADLPTSVVEPVARSAPADNSLGKDRIAAIAPAATAVSMEPPVRKRRLVKGTVEARPPMASTITPRVTKKFSGSRLKLDALDLLMDRDPVLRATTELLTLPQEDGAKRTEAAALWRSMNVSPEQWLQDQAKSVALEKGIQTLQTVTKQNQVGLNDLQVKVQQSESERYANWLVYTLVGLCMASLVALFWLWRRNREEYAPEWLHVPDAQDSQLVQTVQHPVVAPPASVSVPASPRVPAGDATEPEVPAQALAEVPRALADVELDIDLDSVEPTEPTVSVAIAPTLPARSSKPAGRDYSPSGSAALRTCESAEMVDVREQAEFFVSIGQHDRAIDILTTRVAQFGESSPLVCLDLLRMYHDLGREAEFEIMRAEFNRWFSGYVPEFSVFGNDGRSLEEYPDILELLSVLWPSPEVLQYIEGCLYRPSAGEDGVVFDLHAYLDLLLLHGVAKHLVRHTDPSRGSNKPEALRVPARAHAAMVGEAPQFDGDEAAPYRAGEKYRGSKLGALKYPPTTPLREDTTDLRLQVEAERDSGVTDFNFLGLR